MASRRKRRNLSSTGTCHPGGHIAASRHTLQPHIASSRPHRTLRTRVHKPFHRDSSFGTKLAVRTSAGSSSLRAEENTAQAAKLEAGEQERLSEAALSNSAMKVVAKTTTALEAARRAVTMMIDLAIALPEPEVLSSTIV